jgi:hypothetical protein
MAQLCTGPRLVRAASGDQSSSVPSRITVLGVIGGEARQLAAVSAGLP